jgi:hypothetical protein
MTVIVTLSMKGDSRKLEEYAANDPDAMQAVLESGKQHGVIAHRFYGSEDGEIMVVDEWPDEQSFRSFFEENSGRIGPMMEAAGVASEPQVKFWRTLETGDEHGWSG